MKIENDTIISRLIDSIQNNLEEEIEQWDDAYVSISISRVQDMGDSVYQIVVNGETGYRGNDGQWVRDDFEAMYEYDREYRTIEEV